MNASLLIVFSLFVICFGQTCVDKVNPRTGLSDCASRISLCTSATYKTLMTTQCPKTCGFCSSTTCVDLVNAATGVSDCASKASLCNHPTYYSLMTTQCPKTCGRCSTGK